MSENKKYQTFKTISPSDALKLIKEHKNDQNLVILDVRTPWEFSDNHIEGAVNLDYTDPDFNEQIKKLDKTKYYIIYCKSGMRSVKVCEILKKLGFTHVYNIKEGFKGWKSKID
ncbi:rhodanese-like domain-containing protein [Methanobacterium sp. SMA-27]|uniref:rhodanese-like domain-containing protein n=1 Tax=Methanobacterium sp. SMA-27 TaxID=1495336 RepID=UPI00064F92D9|nr:rhodanese-like domain-containing protein [Methanobacterium sp. SMA-27]